MSNFNSADLIARQRGPKETAIKRKAKEGSALSACFHGLLKAFDALVVATALAGAFFYISGSGVLYKKSVSADGWVNHCTYFTPFHFYTVTRPLDASCDFTRRKD